MKNPSVNGVPAWSKPPPRGERSITSRGGGGFRSRGHLSSSGGNNNNSGFGNYNNSNQVGNSTSRQKAGGFNSGYNNNGKHTSFHRILGDRLNFLFKSLAGQQVILKKTNNVVLSGTMISANGESFPGKGFVLQHVTVKNKPHNVDERSEYPTGQTVFVNWEDLCYLNAENAGGDMLDLRNNLEIIESAARHEQEEKMKIDSDIARLNIHQGNLVDRELQKVDSTWLNVETPHKGPFSSRKDSGGINSSAVSNGVTSSNNNLHETDHLESGGKNIGRWDQFKENERMFGVKTTFDENLYTTKLDKNALTDEQINFANRTAKEIESKISANPHIREERNQQLADDVDEETRFSSVVRDPTKYRPPHLRKLDAKSTSSEENYNKSANNFVVNQTSSQPKTMEKKPAMSWADALKKGNPPKPQTQQQSPGLNQEGGSSPNIEKAEMKPESFKETERSSKSAAKDWEAQVPVPEIKAAKNSSATNTKTLSASIAIEKIDLTGQKTEPGSIIPLSKSPNPDKPASQAKSLREKYKVADIDFKELKKKIDQEKKISQSKTLPPKQSQPSMNIHNNHNFNVNSSFNQGPQPTPSPNLVTSLQKIQKYELTKQHSHLPKTHHFEREGLSKKEKELRKNKKDQIEEFMKFSASLSKTKNFNEPKKPAAASKPGVPSTNVNSVVGGNLPRKLNPNAIEFKPLISAVEQEDASNMTQNELRIEPPSSKQPALKSDAPVGNKNQNLTPQQTHVTRQNSTISVTSLQNQNPNPSLISQVQASNNNSSSSANLMPMPNIPMNVMQNPNQNQSQFPPNVQFPMAMPPFFQNPNQNGSNNNNANQNPNGNQQVPQMMFPIGMLPHMGQFVPFLPQNINPALVNLGQMPPMQLQQIPPQMLQQLPPNMQQMQIPLGQFPNIPGGMMPQIQMQGAPPQGNPYFMQMAPRMMYNPNMNGNGPQFGQGAVNNGNNPVNQMQVQDAVNQVQQRN